MLTSLALLSALAAMTLWPRTPFGRQLRRLLVEEPARMLAGRSPRKALFALVVFVALMALAAALPAELAVLAAIDVATYLEVLTAVSLLGIAVRLRGALRVVCVAARRATDLMLARSRTFGVRLAARARSRSPHGRPDRIRPPRTDDFDAPAFA